MRKLLPLLAVLVSCAHAKGPGEPADTEITVTDESGESILGEAFFYKGATKESCVIYGSSCTVAVPAGDYSLTFRKERAGRAGSSIGGTVSSGRLKGCLRAVVHVVPGQKLFCKKKGEFNCAKGAYETLDCGDASAVKSGYKPGTAPDDDADQPE